MGQGSAAETIRDLLPQLSTDELSDVKNRCHALLKLGGKTADKPEKDSTFADLCLDAIRKGINPQVVEKFSTDRLKRTTIYPTFVDNCSTVQTWFEKSKLDRNQTRSLLNIGAKLLYEHLCKGIPVRWDKEEMWLIRAPVPIGVRELMIFFDQLPSCIDLAFPGYMARGLLGIIIQSREVHRG